MKIFYLNHRERLALVAAIAPEYRFIDTTEGPTKGDIIILARGFLSMHGAREPILRFRVDDVGTRRE